MKTKAMLLTGALGLAGAITLLAQGQPPDPTRTPGLQAGQDPNRQAFVTANCKNPPAAPAARGAGGAPGAGRGPQPPQPTQEYTVTAIPGVIAAGQRWKVIYEDTGNNGDGILPLDDGSLLIPQQSKSDVVRIDKDGKSSVVYTDTFTGGALTANSKGQMFIGERALNPAIWTLKPERKLFANMFNGEPFDCLGAAVLNDLAADAKGGVYMTMGGVYYANPKGVVMGRFGTIGGNGIILSPDGRILYVTGRLGAAGGRGGAAAAPGGAPAAPAAGAAPGGGGRGGGAANNGGLVAFDVQPDGSLTNERQFAETCGDGSAVDAAGRIYCTGGRMPDPADPTKTIAGIGVISPKGEMLGIIPAPRNLASVAFGGPNKKTLFAVAFNDVQAMSIEMVAQGYRGRPK
jgi:gluconolactonase